MKKIFSNLSFNGDYLYGPKSQMTGIPIPQPNWASVRHLMMKRQLTINSKQC